MRVQANHDECRLAGINPRDVERIGTAIEKICRDADRLGISIFMGSACSLRESRSDGGNYRKLILANLSIPNGDGGCGAEFPDEDGMVRGE